MKSFPIPRLLVVTAASVLLLSGCAATAAPASETVENAPTNTVALPHSEALHIEDAWVKAADDGMSAAFGVLENSGTEQVTLVSVTSAASERIELHETVENDSGAMVMQELPTGFVIPAGGSMELKPGGNHIMLMGLAAPIQAGDEVRFTLTFADGSSRELTAPAKDYSGANEHYEGDMDHSEHTEHGHDDHAESGN